MSNYKILLIVLSGISLPLALYLPYHFAFITLALGGSLHTLSEAEYFLAGKKILRKRKTYPPIVFLGALVLAVLPFITLWAKFPSKESYVHFKKIYYFLLFAWVFLTCAKANLFSKYKIGVLIIFCSTGLLVTFINPLLVLFLFIHLHNMIPWIFLYKNRTHKQQVLIWFLLINLVWPVVGTFLFYSWGLEISSLSLKEPLETALYNHTLPIYWPIEPDIMLLSLFGYGQFLHYILWIFIVPERKSWLDFKKLATFIPELLFFVGFSREMKKWYYFIPILAVFTSLCFFWFYPVSWRPIYFSLVLFHVLIEVPLIFLDSPQAEPQNLSYETL
ncbi:MAG: hypothetical protein AAF518_04765 [Spirochaetota bacterium]